MTYLLCRNKVHDFAQWKAVFASHKQDHLAAGLRLVSLWRDAQDATNVFFLFEVADVDRATQFIRNPSAAQAARSSGVFEGEYHFLEDADQY